MTGPPTHLTVFYAATAGKQGEELGSDESQIVNLVYLLFDVLNNKVLCNLNLCSCWFLYIFTNLSLSFCYTFKIIF